MYKHKISTVLGLVIAAHWQRRDDQGKELPLVNKIVTTAVVAPFEFLTQLLVRAKMPGKTHEMCLLSLLDLRDGRQGLEEHNRTLQRIFEQDTAERTILQKRARHLNTKDMPNLN